ncbi:hypothetical protein MTR67_051211, partial [Solanum verrucosum]
GTCLKSSYRGYSATQWERCNDVVLSWIGSTVAQELLTTIIYASNAKHVWDDFKERFDKSNLTRVYLWEEVSSLKQETDLVTTYYSKLRDLCDELNVLISAPLCNCDEAKPYVEHLSQQRLLIFLMGLNESYSHVKSDILLKVVVPTVNQAYANVIQEENQRLLGVMDVKKEPLTMMVNMRQDFKSKRKQGQGDTYDSNIGFIGCGDSESNKMPSLFALVTKWLLPCLTLDGDLPLQYLELDMNLNFYSLS